MKYLPLITAATCLGLTACAQQGYSVVAASNTTIGVSLGQQPANGSIDASLGYRRAELAFVPTNRAVTDKNGNVTPPHGQGAGDSADVIMELRYWGIFSAGDNSGIYQRLAVGKTAVAQPGAAALFLKGPDGKADADVMRALQTIPEGGQKTSAPTQSIPEAPH